MTRRPLDTNQVIEAAARLADAEGLGAVTLTRVADDLGVRQPALYRHVDGFDALIRELGLRGRNLLADRLSSAAVGVAADDAVRAMGHAWRAVVRESPGLYEATDRYPCAGDEELEDAVERVVGVIAQALSNFHLNVDDRVHFARSLRSSFHGFAHLEAGDGHPHPMDLDDSFEHLLDLLCLGLNAAAGPVYREAATGAVS